MTWLRWFARKFWLLVVALVVALAILVQTGRLLSPRVGEYSGEIGDWFSQRLGAPVTVEHIALRWQALEVALQIDGLKIGGEGQVALERGLFHLDLLASLWNRELIWKNLEVDGFSARLEQGGTGWQVYGFPRAASAGDANGKSRRVLGDPARIFQLSPKVLIRDAHFDLTLADGQTAELELPEVQLENAGGFHRLVARAFVSGAMESLHYGEESLRLVLEGYGDPRREDDFSLKGYVQLNELLVDRDLVDLLFRLSPLPDKLRWSGRKLAGGRLWLASNPEDGYSVSGSLNLSQMGDGASGEDAGDAAATEAQSDTEPGGGLNPLEALSSNISGHWQPGHSWELVLQQLTLNWAQLEVPKINLQASGNDGEGLQLALDQIELQAWHHLLRQMELLPEKADEWLTALAPGGQLKNLRFSRAEDGELQLAANLLNVSAGAHRGAPAVTGVNGYLTLDSHGGRVELASDQGFSAHFPKLYDQPFVFTRASGTVAWEIDSTDNAVAVYSGPLSLQNDDGVYSGQFLLQLPKVPFSRAADFTLALGLKDVPVSRQRDLVPFTVSDDLRSWLNRGVGKQNSGVIPRAGIIYRGYNYRSGEDAALLALGEHEARQTVQLQADIRDSALEFADGWPTAEDINGHLEINDRTVTVEAPSARLWRLSAKNVQVMVTPAEHGSLLQVSADASGPAADGLRLLQESPLREQLGTAFDAWTLQGGLQGQLKLSQPLGGAGGSPHQSVSLSLSDGQLAMQNLNLEFEALSGAVHYDTETGLEGTDLNGQLWQRPLRAHIQHVDDQGMRDTQVVIEGEAGTDAIARWSRRPELEWLTGDLEYNARVTIPARAREKPYSAVLELNSDLEQVAVNLPAPLGKPAGEKSRFVLRVPIGEQGNLYHLSYGEHLEGQIWQVDGALDRAAIALNAEARLPSTQEISIVGDLSVVDLQPWREALAIYGNEARDKEAMSAGTAESSPPPASSSQAAVERAQNPEGYPPAVLASEAPIPVRLDLSTDQLRLSDKVQIDNIHVGGRGLGQDWQLQFDSEMATGAVSGVLNAATPLQLTLKHLRLPGLEKASEEVGDPAAESPQAASVGEVVDKVDPLAAFDFSALPMVDFSTRQLQVGDEQHGPWSFRLRPSADRLVVSEIQGSFRGVQIEGRGERGGGLGAQLMWVRGEEGREFSQFIGRLSGGDLGNVLQSWGQEAAIESRSAKFDTALRWDGSPAMASINDLTGEIGIDIRSGRFLRASDNAGTSLLRLLSLFNFDTWARRLRLDFSDLVQSGLTFDRVHGEVYFEGDGELLIAVPIQVEGPTSELQMAGRVNLQREDLNLTLVATLPVGNNLAFVAALAGGLPAAAGVYLISKVFKKQVDRVASVSYRISGEWVDPKVRFDRMFDDGAAGREGASAVAESARRREEAQNLSPNPSPDDAPVPEQRADAASGPSVQPADPPPVMEYTSPVGAG
ncbi:AsmA-like C-terminal region-containing protein [Microbulbifer sp.]|uniref:YhdP family phospholipid transporter n=1 Tax=Microbulbifer sp. TaxID=1908541 RepID=UPI002586F6FD|nr:AsmA-like C-terminal region-containing protein [Microbulbifer sp.]